MRTLAALAILLVLTIGVYWKLSLSDRYTWLENPDQALQVRPWLDYQARELHAGRAPLWDPYLLGGQSLIGQVQPGLTNPFNWILFAMPLRDGHIPIRTLHWYWLLIHWVAAMFAYWLCRDLGANRVLAILGGSIFGFAGFMGHATTPQFLMSAMWIPVALLFFGRVWRGYRPVASGALCGAAMGAAFLSGHHNVPIYTAVVIGGLWLWPILRHRRIVPAVVFGVVCFLVSALQVLPAIEYGRQALRWSGAPEPQRWTDRVPYSVHAEYSLGLRAIRGLVIPSGGFHVEPFVGVVAVALALCGAGFTLQRALTRRDKPGGLSESAIAVFALAGLVIAFGGHTPFHRLLYESIPMVEKARYPANAIAICHAGIAALAGSVLFLRPWAAAALLALFLIETATYPVILEPRGAYEAMIDEQSDIAEFLHRQPGWFRVEFDNQVVPYNFGDWHGIEQFNGYAASMLERVQVILGHEATPRIFGVQYRVAKAPTHPSQVEVFRSRSGVKVFRDPRIGEPLWSIHETPCPAPDRFRVIARASNASIFEAEMSCRGLMVVGDPFYRGWRAYLDGRRVPIQQVEAVRGVMVPQGSHRIEFVYRPTSVYAGAALTLLGLAITAVIASREKFAG